MREITVAAIQMACGPDFAQNLDNAVALVTEAADKGAHIVLLQELFELPYFCKDEDPRWFAAAQPADRHPVIERMAELAATRKVVLPVSFFERANMAHYNALTVIDADGRRLGTYRKSHIPDGPGYEEKFYFNPGDTGFRAFDTRYARIGPAICWDQWFPEAARAMALQGAEILLYPTAIGSEPQDPDLDSRGHWERVMQGHAAANCMPVVAANRVGCEAGQECETTFYGRSFVTDNTGAILAQGGEKATEIVTATFDLDAYAAERAAWGLFRDRRPELYSPIISLDGRTRHT